MAKRATIYFDEPIHRALRLKAAETDESISYLVNGAVRRALAEDAKYRVRQGDIRILDEVADSERIVTVVRIGHRRDVYRSGWAAVAAPWATIRPTRE